MTRARFQRALEARQALRGAAVAIVSLLGCIVPLGTTCEGGDPPLILEARIPLGTVRGRLDHFAFDAERQRLFLAELGNDSVAVIDPLERRRIRTLTGLHEPQGLGYLAATDALYVANGGDGSVQLFAGEDLAPSGRIELGEDADNVRVDDHGDRVLVGYGRGSIGVVDALHRKKVADIPLPGHPEGFQLDPRKGRIYVNLPGTRQVAVFDLASGRSLAWWPLSDVARTYPMALDEAGDRIVVAAREPPRLIAFTPEGAVVASLETCGDADDVFADAKRHRLYVICGEGVVDVFQADQAGYARVGRVPTARGARTALLLNSTDRLYVAVPALGSEPAAVWVFRPGAS